MESSLYGIKLGGFFPLDFKMSLSDAHTVYIGEVKTAALHCELLLKHTGREKRTRLAAHVHRCC